MKGPPPKKQHILHRSRPVMFSKVCSKEGQIYVMSAGKRKKWKRKISSLTPFLFFFFINFYFFSHWTELNFLNWVFIAMVCSFEDPWVRIMIFFTKWRVFLVKTKNKKKWVSLAIGGNEFLISIKTKNLVQKCEFFEWILSALSFCSSYRCSWSVSEL